MANNKRKIVGVMPLYDDEKKSIWMLPGYLSMLEEAGAIPLILPLTDDTEKLDYFLRICGGFLFTGGHDVAPSLYHAQMQPWCGEPCPVRDSMERYILLNLVILNKSALGICRGIQLINAVFAGTLYQDLPTETKSAINHKMTPPYNRVAHTVTILEDSPLYKLLGQAEIGVNSYHHQAVKELSSLCKPMAIAPDGIIEALYMHGCSFVWGVQWHPEFNYEVDEPSKKIVKAFVDSIKGE